MRRGLARIDAFDRRLFQRLTGKDRAVPDLVLERLSNAANRSVLWLLIASVMAVFGGERGRRAAARGFLAIAMTSTLVNLPLKYLARRERPSITSRDRPMRVRMPGSFSFPSGHAASAFAFTTAVGLEDPRPLPALAPLASAIAYSRVHLRVHYPLDVLAGAAIGTTMGVASGPVLRAVEDWWRGLAPVPQALRPTTNRLVLVSSPHAGSAEKLARARRAVQHYGLNIAHELTIDEIGKLTSLLGANDGVPPIIVAAGGDGTVGAVADTLVGRDVVLGILPLGTSNDFARSIGIPMHVESAVRLLMRGPIRRVDTGRLSADGMTRHFVHAAATGLSVAFARFATRADLRARIGRFNYAVAAALTLRERPVFACEIDCDGQRQRLNLIHLSIINAPVFGGFLELRVPEGSAEDRTLHVLMIEHLPIRRLLRSALYPAIGVHRGIRGFQFRAAARVTVQPAQPMEVTLDGELAGKLPGTFEVVPSALQVIAPLTAGNHGH